MKIKNGYSEVEIYGLKIRATDDQRLEIDVKEKGNSVDRIYVEFDLNEGCALIYTHNGELNEKLPFNVDSAAASALGRRGGSSTSPAKKKASAENGKKGGRPPKDARSGRNIKDLRYRCTKGDDEVFVSMTISQQVKATRNGKMLKGFGTLNEAKEYFEADGYTLEKIGRWDIVTGYIVGH